MATTLWIIFSAAAFAVGAYFAARLGVPTSRRMAAAAALGVYLTIVASLYGFTVYENNLIVERSTPIERVPARSFERPAAERP